MKLSFRAKPGHAVHWPGLKMSGQMYPHVGYEMKPGDGASAACVEVMGDEPVTVDSDSVEGARFAKLVRRDYALWPADKATADFCGRDYVELEKKDGAWVPKKGAK